MGNIFGKLMVKILSNFRSHWIAIYAKSRGHAYYFDSYGADPNKYVAEYLLNYRRVTRNLRPFQSLISTVCGHYCVYFIYFMSLGLDFDKLLRTLHCSYNSDILVRKFVLNFFRK